LLVDVTDIDTGTTELVGTIEGSTVTAAVDYLIVGLSQGTIYLASVTANGIEEWDVSTPSTSYMTRNYPTY